MIRIIPNKVKKQMNTLINAGYDAYIVGGAVRDKILGRQPKDYDIFTDCSGEILVTLFPNHKVMGGDDRQEKIFTLTDGDIEISRYRANGERTEFANLLADHIQTCDFTINSIAMDINEEMIDLFNGVQDIQDRKLRAVGDFETRFNEDPLRILRALRFNHEFCMLDEMSDHIKEFMFQYLSRLPVERIRDEMLKIIRLPFGISTLWIYNFFECFIPEITKLGTMEGGKYHNELVIEHLLEASKISEKLTNSPYLRLACFLHDIGKSIAYEVTDTGVHFYKHDKYSKDIVKRFMEELKFSDQHTRYVSNLVGLHMFGYSGGVEEIHNFPLTKKAYIKCFTKLEDHNIPITDLLIVIYSDFQGNLAKPRTSYNSFLRNNVLLEKYFEMKYTKQPMKVTDLEVNGKDCMDLGMKGKEIGDSLKKLLDLVIDEEIANRKTPLLNRLT